MRFPTALDQLISDMEMRILTNSYRVQADVQVDLSDPGASLGVSRRMNRAQRRTRRKRR